MTEMSQRPNVSEKKDRNVSAKKNRLRNGKSLQQNIWKC